MATKVYKALHKYGDMSARKVRPFAALIRGKQASEALELLKFVPNRGARLVEAVLKSAIGNAGDRGEVDPEDLIVGEARVDDGPMFKRIMPRARGTAYSILRRMCHIHVALVAEEETFEYDSLTPAQTEAMSSAPTTTATAEAPAAN